MLEVIDVDVRVPISNGGVAEVLSGFSLKMEPGRLYALAGASGSGKTSLVHLLAGILSPASGSVSASGEIVNPKPENTRDAWRRKNCGMIFQDFRLLDELGALSNVLLPTWFGGRSKADLIKRAGDLLNQLGVPTNRGSVSKLSRGEQQRVALARALISDPPIILADEPTASLDRVNSEELIERFVILRNEGKTVVSATHDQRLIDRADVVFRLDKGRLVSSGDGAAG